VSRAKKVIFLGVWGLLTLAGCVSIYDTKVQVYHPGAVDQYNRSIVDQCTPHIYPHRLIQTTAGAGYPFLTTGGALVSDQSQFDQWWAGLSSSIDQSKVVTQNSKPIVDWTQEDAYFIPFNFQSVCQRVEPFGDEMTTDCYTIFIHLLEKTEGKDCQSAPSVYPVFVYIYPRNANYPVQIQRHVLTPTPTGTPTVTPTSTPTVTPTPSEDDE
jgi:hypothetical protein